MCNNIRTKKKKKTREKKRNKHYEQMFGNKLKQLQYTYIFIIQQDNKEIFWKCFFFVIKTFFA